MSSPDLMSPPVALLQSTDAVGRVELRDERLLRVPPRAGHIVDPRTIVPPADPATMGLPSGATAIDRTA